MVSNFCKALNIYDGAVQITNIAIFRGNLRYFNVRNYDFSMNNANKSQVNYSFCVKFGF